MRAGERSPFPSRPGSALDPLPGPGASPATSPFPSLTGSQPSPRPTSASHRDGSKRATTNRNRRLFIAGSGLQDGQRVAYVLRGEQLQHGSVKLAQLNAWGCVVDDSVGGILCDCCNQVRHYGSLE